MATAGGGRGPVLHSLEAEEALVAALLLHDDTAALDHVSDDDIWFDHIRPIVAAARRLHVSGRPTHTVFVLWALGPELDALKWRGLEAESLVLDITGRHVNDGQALLGQSIAKLLHHLAERQRGVRRAERAAVRTFKSHFERSRHSGGVAIP